MNPIMQSGIAEVQALRDDLAQTKEVLGTLIAWMAQSANSPIRRDEVQKLLEALAVIQP